MKLSHIHNAIAVATHGSLRAAARHLGVAQPAISRSIQELEQELGASLFERSVTGVTLTRIGEAFLRRAKIVEHELVRAREEVAQLAGLSTGTVSIGLATAPHVAMLPKVLPIFRRLYPEVKLEITEGLFPLLERRLREGYLDFYVGPRGEERVSREFVMETLCENLRVVLARRGHPMRAATALSELSGEHWVATSVTVDHDAELRPVFEAHNLPCPHVAVLAHSALTTIAVAASTDLLALMPQQWLGVIKDGAVLEHIGIRERLRAPSLRIIQRAGLPLTPVAQHLCDLFRRAALNQPDYGV